MLVGRGGVEPPTFHFSGGRSYQLSYLPERRTPYRSPAGPTKTVPGPGRGRRGTRLWNASAAAPMLLAALCRARAPIV